MNKIECLIHMTDTTNIKDILDSGFLYPQSESGRSELSIERTNKNFIYAIILEKGDNTLGITRQNSLLSNAAILLDKNILKDVHFYINIGWLGYEHEQSFDSNKHPLNSKEFRNQINMIKQHKISSGDHIILSEILLDTKKINLTKYIKGIYFLFGNNYGDVCNVDYTKIVLPLDKFLSYYSSDIRDWLIEMYLFYRRMIKIAKQNYRNISITIINLSTDCEDYQVKKYITI